MFMGRNKNIGWVLNIDHHDRGSSSSLMEEGVRLITKEEAGGGHHSAEESVTSRDPFPSSKEELLFDSSVLPHPFNVTFARFAASHKYEERISLQIPALNSEKTLGISWLRALNTASSMTEGAAAVSEISSFSLNAVLGDISGQVTYARSGLHDSMYVV